MRKSTHQRYESHQVVFRIHGPLSSPEHPPPLIVTPTPFFLPSSMPLRFNIFEIKLYGSWKKKNHLYMKPSQSNAPKSIRITNSAESFKQVSIKGTQPIFTTFNTKPTTSYVLIVHNMFLQFLIHILRFSLNIEMKCPSC